MARFAQAPLGAARPGPDRPRYEFVKFGQKQLTEACKTTYARKTSATIERRCHSSRLHHLRPAASHADVVAGLVQTRGRRIVRRNRSARATYRSILTVANATEDAARKAYVPRLTIIAAMPLRTVAILRGGDRRARRGSRNLLGYSRAGRRTNWLDNRMAEIAGTRVEKFLNELDTQTFAQSKNGEIEAARRQLQAQQTCTIPSATFSNPGMSATPITNGCAKRPTRWTRTGGPPILSQSNTYESTPCCEIYHRLCSSVTIRAARRLAERLGSGRYASTPFPTPASGTNSFGYTYFDLFPRAGK